MKKTCNSKVCKKSALRHHNILQRLKEKKYSSSFRKLIKMKRELISQML